MIISHAIRLLYQAPCEQKDGESMSQVLLSVDGHPAQAIRRAPRVAGAFIKRVTKAQMRYNADRGRVVCWRGGHRERVR